MALSGSQIRETLLRFFEERDHRIVSSGSLVPEGDLLEVVPERGRR